MQIRRIPADQTPEPPPAKPGKISRAERERLAFEAMSTFERAAISEGFLRIAGIDEAGRGPLAGPVAVGICILDPDKPIYGINDSKKLTPASRERLYEQIVEHAVAWKVVLINHTVIDEINILQATIRGMREAVVALPVQPDLLLVDSIHLTGVQQSVRAIVHGDTRSVSIAAASILAKVTRDRLMVEMDLLYPGYGFALHKGYGSQEHYKALRHLGLSPIHRRTFIRPDDIRIN